MSAIAETTSIERRTTRATNPSLPWVLLAMLCISLPLMPYAFVGPGGDAWQMGASLGLADFALFGLAIVLTPVVVRRVRKDGLNVIDAALLALGATLAVSFVLHPSLRSAVAAFRVIASVALAMHLRTCGERSATTVVRLLSIGAIVQFALAAAEQISCGPVGFGFLGETAGPFRSACRSPSGTTRDAYVLAAFATFAAAAAAVHTIAGKLDRRFAGAVLIAGGGAAGLSLSRAAALTVIALAAALVVSSPRKGAIAGLALVAGFAVTAVPLRDAWSGRSVNPGVTADGTRTDDPTNGRSALTRQALRMIEKHPLTGVGPGNYSTALRDDPEIASMAPAAGLLPVHNVALLVTTEGGMPAGIALTAAVALTAVAAFQQKRRWLPLLAAIVPYAMLDIVYWFFVEGVVLLAIAIGLMHAPGDRSAAEAS